MVRDIFGRAIDAAGNALASLGTLLAGEARGASALFSYLRVTHECKAAVISKTTACVIGGGQADDTALCAVMITKALTGTCVIAGLADSDGNAQSIQFDAASVGEKNFRGAVNGAGPLTVTCSNAADDNLVIVLYRDR